MTEILKTKKDILEEKKEKIPLSSVTFQRTWAIWESYLAKSKLRYENANKLIFKWNDIITFLQFWHKYPGNNASTIFFNGESVKYFFESEYRIIAMNIFADGIKPLWEDPKNDKGKYLQLEYRIGINEMNKFSAIASNSWLKLALSTMGESLPGNQFINGIRFVDKTNFDRGTIIMFRIEVWVNKEITEDELKGLIDYLKLNMGCEQVVVKDIDAEKK